ncbi:flagellar type III secretion system pore protein FliP [Candidatus Thiodiazotropha sp. CDECU1]|uniref:flagellar type III secretion system pore protein FliP n=1 Tax=Candidatus Thiodiazotropha sp. CDECU1 TaxID=3065865 RepID=UPI00292F63B1|nr:flagellar type III secretion system pore protein FliP [Candidatus Thiodiazotropha sp. CDECU1]
MKIIDKHHRLSPLAFLLLLFGLIVTTVPSSISAADIELPGIGIELNEAEGEEGEVATAIKIVLGLTVLSLAPAIMIVMTSFTRIIVVLAILRHAFGMQQTPPNTVLISLALFLTLFNMLPTLNLIDENAVQPYGNGQINSKEAFQTGMAPLRDFMIRQTREQDLALMVEVSGGQMPQTIDDVSNLQVIPAFMLSELKAAFQIGFIIFLPFVLIDIVVASILMSMGMLMVPPMMISLPIKILMFVLIDGWNLVVHSLLGSFV